MMILCDIKSIIFVACIAFIKVKNREKRPPQGYFLRQHKPQTDHYMVPLGKIDKKYLGFGVSFCVMVVWYS